MSRIRKFYTRRFHELAVKLGANDASSQAAQFFHLAKARSTTEDIPQTMALALVHAEFRREIGETRAFPHRFFCDVGLGGLARWLRGAGYAAHWHDGLDDAAVIRAVMEKQATLITTDSLMMERGVLRDGIVPSVWVPSALTCDQQLLIVLRELDLPLRESRCMNCGGELVRVPKEDVAERIPPKTYLLDEYFLCHNCNQLFWRGTHWRRITRELARIAAGEHMQKHLGAGAP